jgi:hypothetical protein
MVVGQDNKFVVMVVEQDKKLLVMVVGQDKKTGERDFPLLFSLQNCSGTS